MDTSPPNSLSLFIGHFLKPYKRWVILFVLLGICAGLWGPFNSMLIKHFINMVPLVQAGDTSCLKGPACLIVLNFIVFDNITWRGIGYIYYKYQATIKNQIIRNMLDHSLKNSHDFFQNQHSGRISNQITTLADNIEIILNDTSIEFIRGASLLIVSLIASYTVNPLFFYVLLLWFIIFAVFSLSLSRHFVALAAKHAKENSIFSGQLVDCLTNHSTVRIFSKKDYELSRMDWFFLNLKTAFQKKELFVIILCSVQGALIAVMMGFSSYFLIHLYGKGLITIGDFALILGLSMELGHMMWYTMSKIDDFNQSIGKCKESLSALLVDPDIKDSLKADTLKIQKGDIIFEDVHFHYKTREPLFQHHSVHIKAGQKVGLVGYSGCGKSTFVNLILRLYDVTGGRILIDHHDIRTVTQDSLRASISMIPQDPSLFHRSLMDNIRYGNINATNEDVIRAAKSAHAHDFIKELPQGYDTLVGERGIKLSGGQRQRIAIARAILKNAPILILDEATSQLDSVTENDIQESLWHLMQDKTTVVIAHRLSTLLHMNRIIVFDHGKIIEDGTHTDLLNKNGLYKTLWDTQVGGFLPNHKQGKNL